MASLGNPNNQPRQENTPGNSGTNPGVNPLDISIIPTNQGSSNKSPSLTQQEIPRCFTEGDPSKVNIAEWYSSSTKDHKGHAYTPEVCFEKMQTSSVWGEDVRKMLQSTLFWGMPGAALGIAGLGIGAAQATSYSIPLSILVSSVAIACSLKNLFDNYFGQVAVTNRFQQHIEEPFNLASKALNFLECLALTAVVFNNIRRMNPFPEWAKPDRTELETDNPVKRVSYVLKQIQIAGQWAYENRFGETKTKDGTTQIVVQLKDNKFDQKLGAASPGMEAMKKRWLVVPDAQYYFATALGFSTVIASGMQIYSAVSSLLR